MAGGNGSPTRYTLSTPESVLRQLRTWAEQATRLGRRADYLDVLKRINRFLQDAPHAWGDLLKEYRHIEAVERRGLIPNWVLVWYGVDDASRLVIVRDVLPAPGSPLTTAEGR